MVRSPDRSLEIPLSSMPKITPSAIRKAAKLITSDIEDIVVGNVCAISLKNDGLQWSQPFDIKCVVGNKFSSGCFRDALNIKILEYGDLPHGAYVLKTWNKAAVSGQKEECPEKGDNEVLEDLSRRAVQCQAVAKGLAEVVEHSLPREESAHCLKYIPSYYISLPTTAGTLKPFLQGKFVKYLSNTMDVVYVTDDNGLISPLSSITPETRTSMAHFSHWYTKGKILLTDLQGAENLLTDPEIASIERYAWDESNTE